jgi:hypothetical protein
MTEGGYDLGDERWPSLGLLSLNEASGCWVPHPFAFFAKGWATPRLRHPNRPSPFPQPAGHLGSRFRRAEKNLPFVHTDKEKMRGEGARYSETAPTGFRPP